MSVDAWDSYNMNIKYADVTSQDQKSETRFKLGFDVLTTALGYKAADLGVKGYDLLLSGFTGNV
jgi:hypothetical protein